MSTVLDFPGLSLAERPSLFREILKLSPADLPANQRATFGQLGGWLVSDFPTARALLASTAGVKSRPMDSRRILGGVGAAEGARVREIKHDLIRAMNASAEQPGLMEHYVAAALASSGADPPSSALTEVLSASTLSICVGGAPGEIDGPQLRALVMETWHAIEQPGRGEMRDGLHRFITSCLVESSSDFTERLVARGWRLEQIAEELRAMLLAGWGSTTAAVLSARSLGVAGQLDDEKVLDEVLRLFPPSFMIARTCTEEATALPYEVGDTVVVSPWLIHRHPVGWRAPVRFSPRRWAEVNQQPWFLPFGLGPRRCPASTFARMQAAVVGQMLAPVRTTGEHAEIGLVEGRSPALLPVNRGHVPADFGSARI